VIEDDASGMDSDDLRRFFYMHAENEARRRGRKVRGRFGTGKAAAFGVGTSLQVETVRGGRQWVVRLEKQELIDAAKENRNPQIDIRVDGAPTTARNGTIIIVDGVARSVYEKRVVKELQRRLGRHLQVHNVDVFGERVEFLEPAVKRSWAFQAADEPDLTSVVGAGVVCNINAAVGVVEEEWRGITVTANGFPVAQIEGTGDHGVRLFGACEVPALDADTSTPGPYTDARDLTLNEDNAIAGPLAAWVRKCLATAAGELAAEERERRRRAQDAALRTAASKMEDVLNRHFHGEFRRARNPVGEIGTKLNGVVPDENGNLVGPNEGVAGYDLPPSEPRDGGATHAHPDDHNATTESASRLKDRDPFGEGRGEALRPNEEPKRRRRGGFRIDFEHAGQDAPRSRYLEGELLILVNLDHPEMAAAHRDGDTPLFRMLAFEAAAQEYSFATAYVRIDEDASIDPSDIVEYVRATLDNLTRDVADVVGDLVTIPAPKTPDAVPA
jgi:hypothetical protein